MIGTLKQDLAYAVRQLTRAPLFTIVSTISIAVGMAVAVTVFSIANSMLFKPLPVKDPSHLLHIYSSSPDPDFPYAALSYDDMDDFRNTGLFDKLAAYSQGWTLTITANGYAAETVAAAFASPDLFDAIGINVIQGRTFSNSGADPEIIISQRYRDRVFKPGQQVIGATIHVKDKPFTVIGILPKTFRGLQLESSALIWLPAGMQPALYTSIAGQPTGVRGSRYWSMVGRLHDGVRRDAAVARLNGIANRLAVQFPKTWRDEKNNPLHVSMLSSNERVFKMYGPDLVILIGTLAALIAIVLVLACTNVAGLLLSRAITRRHEIAVRLTLGASRRRLLTQLITESLLLASIGGACGLILAEWSVTIIGKTALFDSFDLRLDWRILLATAIGCVICALIFGTTPSMQALNVDVKAGLSGQGIFGDRTGVRERLMALQVSLAFLFIVLGTITSRSIRSQLQPGDGLHADHLLVADLGWAGRDSTAWRNYVATLITTMRGVDGVTHVVENDRVPLEERFAYDIVVPARTSQVRSGYELVDPEYFATAGIAIVRGHIPRTQPAVGERTAVVNRAMIASLGYDVLGRSLKIGDEEVRIIAVAEDVKRHAIETHGEPYIYEMRSTISNSAGRHYLLARVNGNIEPHVIAEFTKRVRSHYPAAVPPAITTLRSRLEESLAPARVIARVALGIGAVELALAAIGLYSLLLFATLSRTREIGLRMALGAGPEAASLTILKDGWLFVLAGCALGLLLGAAASYFTAGNFVGVRAFDPIPFITAIVGIAVATAAASVIPARKASRIEPMEALRYE